MTDPCPPPGQGVHVWLMRAAWQLRKAGKTPDEAVDYLRQHATRPLQSKEADDAVKAVWARDVPHRPSKLREWVKAAPQVDADWLKAHSPLEPTEFDNLGFLRELYRPGEQIVLFNAMKQRAPWETIEIHPKMGFEIPAPRQEEGVVFFTAPTDGKPRINDEGKPTWRSEANALRFPYALLESDHASHEDWIRFLVTLRLPISAIYLSGGKSVHALWRVDCRTRKEFEAKVGPYRAPLRVLGGDRGAMRAVQLSRMPGCYRANKGAWQQLLWLDPAPRPDTNIWTRFRN